MSENFLIFAIDGEDFAITQKYVHEITAHTGLHEVHNGVNYTKGLINIRGEIISVIDVRKKRTVEETDGILILRSVDCPYRKIGICIDVIKSLKPLNNIQDFIAGRSAFSHVRAVSTDSPKPVTVLDIEQMLHQEV